MKTLAGRYRLVERLGAGGMAVVWRGYDEVLGRQVAVKVLAPGSAADPGFRSQLRREAQAAAKLSHPNITNVYDYGESIEREGPVPYVVMELVDGHSLAQRLAAGPLPWQQVARIGAQVASALAAAHARGLVHRDVTPANVMLAADTTKVVDFGISAVIGARGEPVIMGTPDYVAPERLRGAPALPATDVYGLGLVMYQALAGALPPAHLPAAPPELVGLIRECLHRDPARRPDCRTLAARLGSLGSGRTTVLAVPRVPAPPPPPRGYTTALPPGYVPPKMRRRRHGWRLAAALLAVLLLGLWGFVKLRERQPAAASATPPSAAPSHPHKASPTPRFACAVNYMITGNVRKVFAAQLKIQNVGQMDIDGWTLEFDFPGDQHVTAGWAGAWTQTGEHVRVRDLIYNGSVTAGSTLTIGFVGSYKGGHNGAPHRFTVNGTGCRAADA